MFAIQHHIEEKLRQLLTDIGGDPANAIVTLSNRPELSEFQSAAAMRSAKALKMPPLEIAEKLATGFSQDESVTADAIKPGFLNFQLKDAFLIDELAKLKHNGHTLEPAHAEKLVIDYGGANVAKPLHIGHLRAAIIGEAIKRIGRETGDNVIGDVHLGDWGLQMGQIIAELHRRYPDWPYFVEPFDANQLPSSAPITSEELNQIYPAASARCKSDPGFLEQARAATAALQSGEAPGLTTLWRQFVDVSIADIKKGYDQLLVSFDYWYGESDAHPFLADLIAVLKKDHIAIEDDGALIVPVALETDKKQIPPLMLVKSNGSVGYGATDLATLVQRKQDWHPDHIIYVVDKRQSEHFVQVFRASEKAGLFNQNRLKHVGFGTINGKDGKPFKTREGTAAPLSEVLAQAKALTQAQTGFSDADMTEELHDMITAIATAAVKFGDLQNPYNTDYIFDLEEFVRFEGKTGPYIQYASVRAKAIMEKASIDDISLLQVKQQPLHMAERALLVQLLQYPLWLSSARREWRPDFLCTYVYDLAKAFNIFYKQCPVADDSLDQPKRDLRICLTALTRETINKVLDVLAIPLPQKMLRKEVSA
ncbi:MAG: arginine--tRNA ligase [bacterium]